jgi:hypothetical protein
MAQAHLDPGDKQVMPEQKRASTPSFADARPDLMSQWDFERNTGADPQTVGRASKTPVWWHCVLCGARWQQEPRVRSRYPSSSHHGCQAKLGVLFCEAAIAQVLDQWDFDRNGDLDIGSLRIRSNVLVWWYCKLCGDRWQQSVATRGESTSGYHSGCSVLDPTAGLIIPALRLLTTVRPDIARQWDHSKNGSIDNVGHASTAAAWWLCQYCGLEWEQIIRIRGFSKTDRHRGCSEPFLPVSRSSKKQNATLVRPDLAIQWDRKANHAIFTSKSVAENITAKWLCPFCGAKWTGGLAARFNAKTSHHIGCEITHSQQRGVDAITRAVVNKTMPLGDVPAALVGVFGTGRNCRIYLRRLAAVVDEVEAHPTVTRRTENLARNFITKARPLLAAQFHPTKNGEVALSTLGNRSGSLTWWLCSACGKEWLARPRDRDTVGHITGTGPARRCSGLGS